jgi:hypothetical protein
MFIAKEVNDGMSKAVISSPLPKLDLSDSFRPHPVALLHLLCPQALSLGPGLASGRIDSVTAAV